MRFAEEEMHSASWNYAIMHAWTGVWGLGQLLSSLMEYLFLHIICIPSLYIVYTEKMHDEL